MNENKISFIICCNDDFYLRECKVYLNELLMPDNFEMDVVEIRGASSMASGCNEGMKISDAKYKVYLHQDVFIKNQNFIYDIVSIFQRDSQIGLIGMVGTPYLVKNAVMWEGIRFGAFYRLHELNEYKKTIKFFPLESGYMEVEAVDGLLMATQYDVPWREDLFQKWDFYDVSQSFEFKKAGYKVVVPSQNPEWFFHDCGVLNLFNYNAERKKFLKYYSQFMTSRQNENVDQYKQKVIEAICLGFKGTPEAQEELIDIVKKIENI